MLAPLEGYTFPRKSATLGEARGDTAFVTPGGVQPIFVTPSAEGVPGGKPGTPIFEKRKLPPWGGVLRQGHASLEAPRAKFPLFSKFFSVAPPGGCNKVVYEKKPVGGCNRGWSLQKTNPQDAAKGGLTLGARL